MLQREREDWHAEGHGDGLLVAGEDALHNTDEGEAHKVVFLLWKRAGFTRGMMARLTRAVFLQLESPRFMMGMRARLTRASFCCRRGRASRRG